MSEEGGAKGARHLRTLDEHTHIDRATAQKVPLAKARSRIISGLGCNFEMDDAWGVAI